MILERLRVLSDWSVNRLVYKLYENGDNPNMMDSRG